MTGPIPSFEMLGCCRSGVVRQYLLVCDFDIIRYLFIDHKSPQVVSVRHWGFEDISGMLR